MGGEGEWERAQTRPQSSNIESSLRLLMASEALRPAFSSSWHVLEVQRAIYIVTIAALHLPTLQPTRNLHILLRQRLLGDLPGRAMGHGLTRVWPKFT